MAGSLLGDVESSVRGRGKGLAVLAESAGYAFPRPFAKRVTQTRVELAPGVEGDLYDPGVPAPAIMLVPGGAPRGAEDPAMIRLARSFAGARRVVFVPELALSRQTFEWSDIEALRAGVLALRATGEGDEPRSVGMLGLSYGGSFGLIAAEDPEVAAALSFVAVFGSYARLMNVIQGITTGATIVDGRVVPWRAAPEARGLLADGAVALSAPAERDALARALESGYPDGLAFGTRAVFDMVKNTDPKRTAELAERLPAAFRETIARFSPDAHLNGFRVPLFIMQSSDDLATPPAEAELMHRLVPGSRLVKLEYFQHVRPGGAEAPVAGRLQDIRRSWSFVSWVLGAQE
jgi:pimeloyl-ACP methyl ester carboxylesterase